MLVETKLDILDQMPGQFPAMFVAANQALWAILLPLPHANQVDFWPQHYQTIEQKKNKNEKKEKKNGT